MTLLDVNEMFDTDAKCRELLKRLRWPAEVECVRCHMPNIVRLATAKELYFCRDCKYQFSVTAGTIFNDSHLSLKKWFVTTYLLCESRKGMSANQIKRIIGGSYKTAWYLCHRIRAAMSGADRPMLDGTVEMDETYVGGVKRGIGARAAKEAKEVVIGIRQRGGDVRFFHAEDENLGCLNASLASPIRQSDSDSARAKSGATALAGSRIQHPAGRRLDLLRRRHTESRSHPARQQGERRAQSRSVPHGRRSAG